MPRRGSETQSSADRPILPWRIVAGGFLHFGLPAYLIALLVDFVVVHPTSASAWLPGVASFSGHFLLGYLALALACALTAALVDPLLRARKRRVVARTPPDDAALSRQRLTAAIAAGRGAFGSESAALLRAMETARWDHGDPKYQSLARDLDEVVRSSTIALRTAPSERRSEVAASAVQALRHLDAARRELEAEAARQDEDHLLTAARYVELRYGSDSSGTAD